MIKLLSAKELRDLDQFTIKTNKISSLDLMGIAVNSIVEWFKNKFDKTNSIVFFCGNGNNGGDGLLMGSILNDLGYNIKMVILENKGSNEFEFQLSKAKKRGLIISDFDLNKFKISNFHVIIDAIFGYGLNRPLEGKVLELINYINNSKAIKVSIDVPSGLPVDDCFSSKFVHSDFVTSLHVPKLSFYFPENLDLIKDFDVIDIGLSRSFYKKLKGIGKIIEETDIKKFFKQRLKNTHKGIYGHGLLLSGSKGKIGASILSGKAALRSGIGLLTICIPKRGEKIIQKCLPESMIFIDQNKNYISSFPDLDKFSAIGIGPGMGTKIDTIDAFSDIIIKSRVPMVIDADGINILSLDKHLLNKLPSETILTPHLGEFKKLAGDFKNSIEKIKLQKKISKKFKLNIIVKGPFSTITNTNGELFINPTGNPGMATAGSGDVLTGIITALLSKGMAPFEALVSGVYIHGLSADLAKETLGEESLIASDIINNLSSVFESLKI